MAYFPMFLDIEGKHCLVVGGGKVALRKVQVLLDFGAADRKRNKRHCRTNAKERGRNIVNGISTIAGEKRKLWSGYNL